MDTVKTLGLINIPKFTWLIGSAYKGWIQVDLTPDHRYVLYHYAGEGIRGNQKWFKAKKQDVLKAAEP